jgi:hypothetical protein
MNNDIYFRFERQPIGHKLITDIPGIEYYGDAFTSVGFTKAYHLLGQYLLLNKDNGLFNSWLKNEFPIMSNNDIQLCVESLYQWTYNNL